MLPKNNKIIPIDNDNDIDKSIEIKRSNPLQRLSKKELEKINLKGEKIYNTNEYLKYINDIMADGKFEEFMNKHIQSKIDVNTAMIYFNLYSIIKNQFKDVFKRDINKGEMLYFLRESMRNKIMRKFAIESANKYTTIERKVTNMIKNNKEKVLLIGGNEEEWL